LFLILYPVGFSFGFPNFGITSGQQQNQQGREPQRPIDLGNVLGSAIGGFLNPQSQNTNNNLQGAIQGINQALGNAANQAGGGKYTLNASPTANHISLANYNHKASDKPKSNGGDLGVRLKRQINPFDIINNFQSILSGNNNGDDADDSESNNGDAGDSESSNDGDVGDLESSNGDSQSSSGNSESSIDGSESGVSNSGAVSGDTNSIISSNEGVSSTDTRHFPEVVTIGTFEVMGETYYVTMIDGTIHITSEYSLYTNFTNLRTLQLHAIDIEL